MNDKTKPSDEEVKLFRDAMQDVQPLVGNHKVKPPKSTVAAKPYYPAPPSQQPNYFPLSDNYLDTVTVDQQLSFHVSGISPSIMKSLRHGTYPIDYKLDLHGATVEIARTKLCQTLDHCYQNNFRCLLVIHGKSHRLDQIPILKNHINHWLKQIPIVLAFCTAQPKDGGAGAVYVWLKKAKSLSD